MNSTIEELSNPNIQFLGGKLSPDNKFFVYKGGKEDFKQSTWLLNINTKEHREVSGFGFIYGWTPEGSVLLSGSERRRFSIDDILFEATGIDILDPVNGLRLSFIEGVYGAREPKYSPDGSVIAYLNTVSIIKKPEDFLEFHEDIFIADKNGKDLYRLTEGMSVKHIVWSPDGNHILFTTEEKEMYTINIDGTGLRLIGNDLYDFPPPVWTTENQIIYHSGRESKEYDTADIYAFNPVTNTEHLVIGGDGIQQAWELNGNIAVVRDMPSDGDCEAQILINLISGVTHNLYYQMQDTPK